jgi:hypothetical protein
LAYAPTSPDASSHWKTYGLTSEKHCRDWRRILMQWSRCSMPFSPSAAKDAGRAAVKGFHVSFHPSS